MVRVHPGARVTAVSFGKLYRVWKRSQHPDRAWGVHAGADLGFRVFWPHRATPDLCIVQEEKLLVCHVQPWELCFFSVYRHPLFICSVRLELNICYTGNTLFSSGGATDNLMVPYGPICQPFNHPQYLGLPASCRPKPRRRVKIKRQLWTGEKCTQVKVNSLSWTRKGHGIPRKIEKGSNQSYCWEIKISDIFWSLF